MVARLRRAAGCAAVLALVMSGAACTGDDGRAAPAAGETTTSPLTSSPTSKPTRSATAPHVDDLLGRGPGLRRFFDQRVEWTDCGDGFQCATVLVPLDYDDLTGDTIGLAVNRLPVIDDGSRIGSLLVNPGGPGGSGVDVVRQSAATRFAALHEAYDIVGFDPRGVGASEPLQCMGTDGLDRLVASDPDPDTPGEVTEAVRLYRAFGATCERAAPDLLPHLSTTEVARDLDVIRAVVGDRQLHYLGFSYGTLIGSVYAELFPDRVGRMVLDGALDPSLDYEQTVFAQAGGFETALRAYAADCVTKPGCPLGTDVETGLERVRGLLDRLDTDPLPTDDPGRPLTEGLGAYGIAEALYTESLWVGLTLALKAAMEDGDGQGLLTLADLYAHRGDDGYGDNLLEVYNAVSCVDDRSETTVAEVADSVDEFVAAAPTLGTTLAWSPLVCAVWPVEAADPLPGTIDARGAAPIVVVGTTRDPATPYAEAEALADQLDSGVLLTRDGDGHTAYTAGNTCIDSAVDAYLVEGTVPADGTRC